MSTKKTNKWNYNVRITYLNMLFNMHVIPASLRLDSKFILEVCQKLNEGFPSNDYNADSLLSDIASLHLENKHNSCFMVNIPQGKIYNFHKLKSKSLGLDKSLVQPYLIDLATILADKEKFNLPKLIYNHSLSLNENVLRIKEETKLLELEIYALLHKQGDILIRDGQILKKNNQDTELNTVNPLFNKPNNIIALRDGIAKAFDHKGNDYNLYLLNDGTGSGKTHNVVMNFIRDYPNKDKLDRKSLIFIAPQKNQLFVNDNVFKEAKKANIPLLLARSRKDFINLDSKIFMDLNSDTSEFYLVKDFFEGIFNSLDSTEKTRIDKELRDLYIDRVKARKKNTEEASKDEAERIPSINVLDKIYRTYRDFEKTNHTEKKYTPQAYEHNYKQAGAIFFSTLNTFVEFIAANFTDKILLEIFNADTIYNGLDNFKNTFGKNEKFYQVIYKLLCYVMPFEVAKYLNCIIYLTGDKSQFTFKISEASSKYPTLKTNTSYELEEMVSGYSISKSADILDVYDDSSQLGTFLDKDYFINNNNYFITNELGFSIVFDEEHILYNSFIENYTYKNITAKKDELKVNTVHALASIGRWIKNSKFQKRELLNNHKIVEEKNLIIGKLYKALKEHTVLKTDTDIEEFFNSISSNEFGILIKTSDYGFIQTVCDHIVSFSPKLIMLKEYLQTIKIILDTGSDYLLVAKDNISAAAEKSKYNIYDLFQVILTTLYVCKDSSVNLRNMLDTEKENNNQNVSLYHLLGVAHENKDFLKNLFSSSLNLDASDQINIQFSYFLKKIGFNFLFPEKIIRKDYDEAYIKIEPHIFIIKELPEVKLLQTLYNDKNTVFLLSATRGFNKIFAGNYSEYFFNEIDKHLPKKVRIFQREKQVDNPMAKFIEARFNFRNSVEIIDLKFNSSSEEFNMNVERNSYKINQIELISLNKNNDLKLDKTSYPLINGNNKNYMSQILSNIVKTKQYKFLHSEQRQAEILSAFKAIIHAFENNEHAIVMTLSNRFYNEFMNEDNFLTQVFGVVRHIRKDDDNKYKVVEYSPIPGSKKKLRIVCFDADLGKVPDLKEHFIIDPETIIVLVSSFASAGTGLNLTLTNSENQQQDFNAKYVVSSPFYTSIKDKDGYGGLSNQLLIFKYFSHQNGKTINDLSEGLSSREIKSILKKEHAMEKVKTIMQSSGRIERKDCKIDTKIYFVDNGINNLFEETMSEFNEMFKLHANQYQKTIISNVSMINKSLLKTSLNHIASNSLTHTERNKLESESTKQYSIYENFFCNSNNFPKMLNQYRLLNPDYIWVEELNSIFRGYASPNYSLKGKLLEFMKQHRVLLEKTNSLTLINGLAKNAEVNFDEHKIPKNKLLTINYDNHCYSDYSQSNNFITDKHFFDYGSKLKISSIDYEDDFLKKTLKKYSYNNSLTILPNVYLSHIIRGNVAEQIFAEYLTEKNVKFNDLNTYFGEDIKKKTYELFDFYIVTQKNKTIYCIDTKNWSLYNDAGAIKTLDNLPAKIAKIKNLSELDGYNIKFIYLNMFPSLNEALTNGLSLHLGSYDDVDYVNFIDKKLKFVEKKKTGKEEVDDKYNDILNAREFYQINFKVEQII
jgi:hypothetical protein